jgi:hypothetical protein
LLALLGGTAADRVEGGALLLREQAGDALARLLAQRDEALTALLGRQVGRADAFELRAHVGEDRVDLALLVGGRLDLRFDLIGEVEAPAP